jgi:hypothetical protein
MTSRMLKKNPAKKSLALTTETVRCLADRKLSLVAGGVLKVPSPDNYTFEGDCPSNTCKLCY